MDRRRWIVAAILLIAGLVVMQAVLGSGTPGPAATSGTTGGPTAGATAGATSVAASAETAAPMGAATDGPTVNASVVPTTSAPTSGPTGTTSFAPGTDLSPTELLALLPVRLEDRAGYQRSLFTLWIDADGNGCDTRHEVLIAEAVIAPTVGVKCRLTGGRWHSLYDGLETTDPSTFDIDHVVPLAEAWDSGASGWTADRRTAYANDLGVSWSLLAVSATSNRSKGDRDPAGWMPPLASVRCQYVSMWLAIKVRWSLAVDSIEAEALATYARVCHDPMPVVPAP